MIVGIIIVLEAEWVLRTVHRLARLDVASALRGFLGLPRATVEAREAVVRAMTWADEGTDVADAPHVSFAADHDASATFHRALQGRGWPRAVPMVSP